MRTQFRLHDGVRICHLDFSHVADEEEALQAIEEAKRLIATMNLPDGRSRAATRAEADQSAHRSVPLARADCRPRRRRRERHDPLRPQLFAPGRTGLE